VTGTNKSADTWLDMVEGQTYLIQFFMAATGDMLADPTFDIGPILSGTTCDVAIDLGEYVDQEVQVEGTFNVTTVITGSCDTDTSPGKSFWYTITPEVDGLYQLAFLNGTTTAAWTRMAVFAGGTCSELGEEVACLKNSGKAIDTTLELTGGVTYYMLFYTDGATYTMVDPSITLTEIITAEGDTCSDAIDLTSVEFPYSAEGSFSVDPVAGGSCDSTPTNVVWFDYTASQSGLFDITATNESATGELRLVVFKAYDEVGLPVSCGPDSEEIACVVGANDAASVKTTLQLQEGMPYRILVHSDSDGTELLNPELNIEPIIVGPGDSCGSALAFTDADLPFSASGEFNVDGPKGGSCDSSPNNVVWVQYTATVSGPFTISGWIEDEGSAARIAVFEGAVCEPLGTEVACDTSDTNLVDVPITLEAGAVYTIALYTDADENLNTNPIFAVNPFDAEPGQHCLTAADITGQTMPFDVDEEGEPQDCPEGANCLSLIGTFDDDPSSAGGSCDSSPNNVVWFQYTAEADGPFEFSVINQSETNSYSRIVIYEGTSCGTMGTEINCTTSTNKKPAATAELEAGKTYLVLYYTDDFGSDSYTTVDPQIKVEPFEYSMGASCDTIMEIPIAGETFTSEGNFTGAPAFTTTCSDNDPVNSFWFGFFPVESGTYSVVAVNQTTTFAYSRMSVYEGFSCDPLPTELSCDQAAGKTLTKSMDMVAGTPYMFLFYTDGSSWTMVDPTITIELTAPAPEPEPEPEPEPGAGE
jgi:hypothetical protein